jgi:hypothetical protein
MRGRNYCFFHLNVAGHRLRVQQFAARGHDYFPELPLLEDAASIQLALMQVNEWLLRGVIDYKRAGLLLYSLQTASCNLRNMQKEAEAEAGIPICNRYDSFEQDYELDAQTAASLRIEDPEDKAEAEAAEKARAALQNEDIGSTDGEAAGPAYDPVMALIAKGEAMGFLNTRGVCMSSRAGMEHGPQHITDREQEDQRVRIPMNLTEMQYLQAKNSIEEYEEQHNIDAEHPKGRKPTAQRAAISQKIFMGARKPVASVGIEQGVTVSAGAEIA